MIASSFGGGILDAAIAMRAALRGVGAHPTEYRGYTIRIEHSGALFRAVVDDGEGVDAPTLFVASAESAYDAEQLAKQWIDEELETSPDFDLHSA